MTATGTTTAAVAAAAARAARASCPMGTCGGLGDPNQQHGTTSKNAHTRFVVSYHHKARLWRKALHVPVEVNSSATRVDVAWLGGRDETT